MIKYCSYFVMFNANINQPEQQDDAILMMQFNLHVHVVMYISNSTSKDSIHCKIANKYVPM